MEETLTAWRIHQRIHVRLIEALDDEGLRCTLSKHGGRGVARQFAHLQFIRVAQLRKRAAPLAEGLRTFATDEEPDQRTLVDALEESSKRIEEWIQRASRGDDGVRTMKGGLVATVAYLISHESHHRGGIVLTLKQCGHPVEKSVRDALWGEWSKG